MNKLVRKILEKQMQLLVERAEKEDLNGVSIITDKLITLATILDPELRKSFEAWHSQQPCVGYAFNWLESQKPEQNSESADTPENES